MINLGKTLLLFLFISPILFGAVEMRVDKTTIEEGDIVTMMLEINGDKVLKPSIDSLCESQILSQSTHSSYVISNGNYQNNYTLTYQFAPEKSCEIEPIEIEINGKKEKTKPIKITVKPLVYTKDSSYILELNATKQELYVAEEFEVNLYFKQKHGTNPLDSTYTPPTFKGFWIKAELPAERYEEGGYSVTKVKYILAAQREGTLTITPAKMNIKTRGFGKDMYGFSTQNLKQNIYSSNRLDFTIQPLPSTIRLIGDFTLEVLPTKNRVNTNEPLELMIKIEGKGNFEDIGSLKPYINGVSIFEEKEQIATHFWSQKLTFVADHNFTIAPFTLEYFNPETKEVCTLTSESIEIEVNNQKTAPKLEIYKGDTNNVTKSEIQNNFNFIYFFVGLLLGFVGGFLLAYIKPWQKGKSHLSIKEPKVLLMKLVPHKEDRDVQKMIEDLERHIYQKKRLEIDKKLLKEIVKKYNLS
ncbi:MAG: BatD family protein [Sulfurimonadaceae bacterium]|jgi:hypothetical protein|nr:BatD family protein [Sulfurimonadaceae bacterium]